MSTPASTSSEMLNGNLVVQFSKNTIFKDKILTIAKIPQGHDSVVPQIYESDVKIILDYLSDGSIYELEILNEPGCPEVVNLLIRQLLDRQSRLFGFSFYQNIQCKTGEYSKGVTSLLNLIINYPDGQEINFYHGMLSVHYNINAATLLQAIEQLGSLVVKLRFQGAPALQILQPVVDKCFSDRHYSRIKSIEIDTKTSSDCQYSYTIFNENSSVFLSICSSNMMLDSLLSILNQSLVQTVGLEVTNIDSPRSAIVLLQWLQSNKRIKVLDLRFNENNFQFSDQDFTKFLAALLENKNLIKLGLRNFLLHTTIQQRLQFIQALSKTDITSLNLSSDDNFSRRNSIQDCSYLAAFGNNKKLQNLSMRNCGVNGRELKHLSGMTNLTSIDLGGVHNYNITGYEYLNGFMSFLKATSSLKKLCLSDFQGCGPYTMSGVANDISRRSRFPGVWNIEHLRLENYDLTYQEAEAICDQVVVLDLFNCKIDPQGLQAFLRSDSLKFFRINSPMTLKGIISEEQLLELVKKNNNLLCFYSGFGFGLKATEEFDKHLMENRARLAATISDSTNLPPEILSMIRSYDDPFAEPDWDFYQSNNLSFGTISEQKSTSVDSASVSIVSAQSASCSSYSSSSCSSSYSDAKLLATSSIGTLLSASSGSANTSSAPASSSDSSAAISAAKLDS